MKNKWKGKHWCNPYFMKIYPYTQFVIETRDGYRYMRLRIFIILIFYTKMGETVYLLYNVNKPIKTSKMCSRQNKVGTNLN